jgi:hypothetical protein
MFASPFEAGVVDPGREALFGSRLLYGEIVGMDRKSFDFDLSLRIRNWRPKK